MSTELFTDIRVFPIKNATGNLKANCKVVIAGTVEISCSVMNGSKGLFVSMPSQKVEKPGEPVKYFPYVKLIDKDTKDKLDEVVLAEFNKGTDSTGTRPFPAGPASTAPARKKLPF